MSSRVQIDLNVRCEGNLTFAGIEDASAPVCAGEALTVYEPEDGVEGPATVARVDEARGLIYLRVDWPALRASRA